MTRGRRARWYDALDGVTTEVMCSGAAHRVSWRHGRLVLHDHDLSAERAAVALGGAPPACIAVLDAWRDRCGWDTATRGRSPGFRADPQRPGVPDALVAVRELGVCRRWD